jgi:hypothetical protein
MTTQSTLCPICQRPSTNTWLSLYTGDYTGRVWGGRCPKDGLWADSTACTPRPKEKDA